MTEKTNPPLDMRNGLANVHRWQACDTRENTTILESAEAFAVAFVARKARISLPTARVVCLLAGIGARIA